MVDDTIINVGSMRKIVYVAEPLLRRILYITCDVANIPTSLALLRRLELFMTLV